MIRAFKNLKKPKGEERRDSDLNPKREMSITEYEDNI
jgi:hypothetical protein